MNRYLTYRILSKNAGCTILDFLRKEGFSRHILSSMKTDRKSILLNGQRGYGRTVLKEGDLLHVCVPETESPEKILPVSMPLDILFEDEDLLVLNKAANVPVHPSLGNYENTLANAAAYYFASKGEAPFVFRCINRLDRDTTGALILAKNALSASILSDQMRARRISRTYLAVVRGVPPEKGTVSAPIARKKDSVMEREVNFAEGEPAVTHFERLTTDGEYSLVELHLETGRTHQIRVHMNYLGYPLPGDYLYYPDYSRIRRQALHSYQLEFFHPLTRKPLLLTAPVPEDFRNLLSPESR